MKKIGFILIFCFSVCFSNICHAAYEFQTAAKSAILIDFDTNAILFEKNADELMAPASMSKLMTAYMVFDRVKKDNLSLDHTFTVSQNAWKKGGSKSGGSTMFLDPNSKVKVVDLIQGIIVQSGNDACIVVAENISGTEENFATEMTAKARALGLEKSVFKNATGLPHPEHLMTPKELAMLSCHLIRDFPEFYTYYSQVSFTYNGIKQGNRNPLLYSMQGQADGLKTGHTEKSGYGLAGSVKSKDGKRRLVFVINGLNNMKERGMEAERLVDFGLREFDNYTLFGKDAVVAEIPVAFGKQKTVGAKLENDVVLTLRISDKEKTKVKINYDEPIKAPVKKGQKVGLATVDFADGSSAVYPLVAARDVARMGYFERMKETLVYYFTFK